MKREEIAQLVKEIRENERMLDELNTIQETLKDKIKQAMTAENVEEIAGNDYKITWHSVTSTRLDTTAIKKAFPAEALAPYMKTSSARRFILT